MRRTDRGFRLSRKKRNREAGYPFFWKGGREKVGIVERIIRRGEVGYRQIQKRGEGDIEKRKNRGGVIMISVRRRRRRDTYFQLR